jgi:hypothetical protein
MADNTYLTSPTEARVYSETRLSVRPPFTVGTKADDVLAWNNAIDEALKDAAMSRSAVLINNLLLYRGSYFEDQDQYGNTIDSSTGGNLTVSSQMSRLTIPELYEYTDNRVNRTARNSTSFAVVPPTQEHTDKNGAKAVKSMLDTIEYQNRLQKVYREVIRDSVIFGENWLLTLWDDTKGDIHPDWKKAQKSKATDRGKTRTQVKIKDHEFEFDPKNPLRIGDVIYRRPLPWEFDIDPRPTPEECQWMRWRRWRYVDELKEEFPGKAKQIEERKGKGTIFNMENLETETCEDMILDTQIWCRSTRYLGSGRYFHLAADLVLEDDDNPYPPQDTSEWGNMPGERLTDIDVSGAVYGFSSFQLLAPLNHAVNQIFTMAKNSALVAGHPKIMAPMQSGCKAENFTNDMSVIWYRAPFKPETITSSVISPDLFALIKLFAEKLMQVEGRQSTSRGGEIPPNIRSGRQMAMLEELEGLRSEERSRKKDEFIVAVMRKTMALIGLKYPEQPERMLNILGRDKMPLIKSFDVSVLNKSYDCRILPASLLSTVPQERINQVKELYESDMRKLYPDEQWAAMLDMGVPGKFFDAVTSAADKADWENEELINGHSVPEPVDGDDHIVHWRTHIQQIRSVAFLDFSDKMKEEATTHCGVHEMEIYDQMAKTQNPMLQQWMMTTPLFPSFYTPPPQLPMPPEMMGPGGPGAAPPQGPPPPPPSGPGGAGPGPMPNPEKPMR